MSKLRYKGPARPIPLVCDPFPDAWLLSAFAVLAAAFVFIVFVMGY